MKVVSESDLRVALLSGAVVLFEAGVEREVSDEIGSVALLASGVMAQRRGPQRAVRIPRCLVFLFLSIPPTGW